ncbi:hypothetical protein BD410DRAFT_902498 [Rickenella mellea]|uniref:Bacteriophage T5 Orf172 DNA-binding domain-containing protein n=1 Tax=Rickenella mellea TaxID=50990 RepID=A0A4Y7PLZ3_9AGAM|nr:hypothetical protein BD410DRAFT_902498 [Rickenella mellea]
MVSKTITRFTVSPQPPTVTRSCFCLSMSFYEQILPNRRDIGLPRASSPKYYAPRPNPYMHTQKLSSISGHAHYGHPDRHLPLLAPHPHVEIVPAFTQSEVVCNKGLTSTREKMYLYRLSEHAPAMPNISDDHSTSQLEVRRSAASSNNMGFHHSNLTEQSTNATSDNYSPSSAIGPTSHLGVSPTPKWDNSVISRSPNRQTLECRGKCSPERRCQQCPAITEKSNASFGSNHFDNRNNVKCKGGYLNGVQCLESTSGYVAPWNSSDLNQNEAHSAAHPAPNEKYPLPIPCLLTGENFLNNKAHDGQVRPLWSLAPPTKTVPVLVKSAQSLDLGKEHIQSTCRKNAIPCKGAKVNLSNPTSDGNCPRSPIGTTRHLGVSHDPKPAISALKKALVGRSLQCSGTVVSGRQCLRRSAGSELSDVWYCYTHKPDNVQCSGTTLKGNQCLRKTPNYPAPWYCWQHLKQSKSAAPAVVKVKSPPFSSHTVTGENTLNSARRPQPRRKQAGRLSLPPHIEGFIPKFFSDEKKAKIRAKMEQPLTDPDGPGLVYVFEITDPDAPIDDFIHLKIGMTIDVMNRLKTWRRDCRPLQFSWTGDWKVSYRRHIERLVHLELDGLVEYFEERYISAHDRYEGRINSGPCVCGTKHKEIFSFRRSEIHRLTLGTRYEGTDGWTGIVKGMVQRWERYAEKYSV